MGASIYILRNKISVPVVEHENLPDNISLILGKESDNDTNYFKELSSLTNVFITPTIQDYKSDKLLEELLKLLKQVNTKYVMVGELKSMILSPDCNNIVERFNSVGKKVLFCAHRKPFYTYSWTHEIPDYLFNVDKVLNRDLLGDDLYVFPMFSFGETKYMISMFEKIKKELLNTKDIPELYRYQVATRKVFNVDQENIGIDNTHRVFSILDEKDLVFFPDKTIKASFSWGTRIMQGILPVWFNKR
jgi:hypothetical protein